MAITAIPVGPLQANCYVLTADDSAECVVIDPGQQAIEPLDEVLTDRGLTIAALLVTHGHFDHVASAAQLSRSHRADVYLGAGDVPLLTGQWSAMPEDLRAALAPSLQSGDDLDNLRPDRLTPLAGGERLRLAGLDIDVLAVPGHTPGSITYLLRTEGNEPDIAFTGDTLFAGTIGRTDLPGGSSSQILASIDSRLHTLPDDTIVAPGHGPASTIGDERMVNPHLRGL